MKDLVIKQKFDDMVEYAYKALNQFPKSQRHVLSAEIRLCMERVDALIIRAQKMHYKKNTLQDLDIELAQLQSKVRLAKRLGYLPPKKYELWSKALVELGKMVGGWIKSMKGQESGRGPRSPVAGATATTARSARGRSI